MGKSNEELGKCFPSLGRSHSNKDLEEPTSFKELDNYNIKNVTCCYKYCVGLNDKGELYAWGSHMQDKAKKFRQEEKAALIKNP